MSNNSSYKPWIKFYKDFIIDPKIKCLSPIEQLIFIYLLCLADNYGIVKFATEEGIMEMIGIIDVGSAGEALWQNGMGAFSALEKYGMIVISNNIIRILNYEKRQRNPFAAPLTGAERQARYRQKRLAEEMSSDAKVTGRNGNRHFSVPESNEKVTLPSPLYTVTISRGGEAGVQPPTGANPPASTPRTSNFDKLEQWLGVDEESIKKKEEEKWFKKAAKDAGMTIEDFKNRIK